MRHGLQLAAALLLAFVAYSFQAVQLPGRVLACSCAGPPRLANVGHFPNEALLIGTIGESQGDRTSIRVEGWFVSPAAEADVIFLRNGTSFGSSCDLYLTTSERWLLTLYLNDQDLYETNTCSPNGLVGTPEGGALRGEAIALFGPPRPPPPSTEPQLPPATMPASPQPRPQPTGSAGQISSPAPIPPPSESPEPPGSDVLAPIWAAAAFGVGLLLLATIVVIARRRPPG